MGGEEGPAHGLRRWGWQGQRGGVTPQGREIWTAPLNLGYHSKVLSWQGVEGGVTDILRVMP